jgi:hypothetical protein
MVLPREPLHDSRQDLGRVLRLLQSILGLRHVSGHLEPGQGFGGQHGAVDQAVIGQLFDGVVTPVVQGDIRGNRATGR